MPVKVSLVPTPPDGSVCEMTRYKVYKASFRTEAGTMRTYLGFCKLDDVRRAWHRKRPPVWMRCKKQGTETSFTELEWDIDSKGTALVPFFRTTR